MATIIIKRKLDPLHIEDARAQAVKNRLFGLHGVPKAAPTELVDLGEWSGQYGQIATIEIGSAKRLDEWTESTQKKYTDDELVAFHKEMQKYMTVKHDGGRDRKQTYDHYDIDQYYLDNKCISFKDHLGVQVRCVVMVDGKIPLTLFENKVDQWKAWRERKEYGKQKRAEELAAMADGIDFSIPQE